MNFLEKIKERAKNNKKTIVLPESMEARTLEAVNTVLKEGISNIILIGSSERINDEAKSKGFDVSKATFIDPENFEKMDFLIESLFELRKTKGMTIEKAKELLLNNPLYLGAMLVKSDIADGMVAGAINSSSDVLRAALQIVKTAPGSKLVSSFFVMDIPNCDMGENGQFVFSDCGMVQNPTAQELAIIAESSAKTFKQLLNIEPVVAMLSHSTLGSSKHKDVSKVQEATKIAKENNPNLIIDGEFQLDTAIVPEVAQQKAPDSKVAGRANVLIFPTLDAANIGYKLVQRFAKADAFGPMTQGIAKPVNDLSRGCFAVDIIGAIAITAVQAQDMETK